VLVDDRGALAVANHEHDRFPDQPQPGVAAVQVVRGSASIGWNDIRIVWYVLIRSARHRIRLQTAYFSPDAHLVAALKEAVSRGVDVDIPAAGSERGQARCGTSE
jgi:cardiolipin synthase A/B